MLEVPRCAASFEARAHTTHLQHGRLMRIGQTARLGVLALLLGTAVPAHAQLGGLKKKLQARAVRAVSERLEPRAGVAAPVYNEHVLVMTPEVLDRLALALAAEEAKRKEVAAVAPTVREKRQARADALSTARASRRTAAARWQSCSEKVQSRPEYEQGREEQERRAMEIGEQVKAGKMDAQTASRAATELASAANEMNRRMMEAVEAECGADPRSEPTPAAEALPSESELAQAPLRAALAAGGFTSHQYGILKERVTPFCAATAAAGEDGGARIPGSDDQFYVYSAEEVEALRPRCDGLLGALRDVL